MTGSCPEKTNQEGGHGMNRLVVLALSLTMGAACAPQPPLQPLADRLGVSPSPADWRLARVPQDEVPQDEEQVFALAQRLFADPAALDADTKRSVYQLRAGYHGCDQVGVTRLLRGLADQPRAVQRRVAAEIADLGPGGAGTNLTTENMRETDHFRIYSTLAMNYAVEVGEQLETAWATLCAHFTCPDVSTDADKIVVSLHSMPSSTFGLTCSDCYIHLNSNEVRRALDAEEDHDVLAMAAHELFHQIQYAYGFQEEWPRRQLQAGGGTIWFEEGTASWAEAFVVRTAMPTAPTDADFWKHEAISTKPGIELWRRDYDAMPFFLNASPALPSEPEPVWMEVFLDRCRTQGHPIPALKQMERDRMEQGQEIKYLHFATSKVAHLHQGPYALDPKRLYLRPYRVRMECSAGSDWSWTHDGKVDEVSAAYYEFVNPEGEQSGVRLAVSQSSDEGDSWVDTHCLGRPASGPILCKADDLQESRTLLTIVSVEGFGLQYRVVASCEDADGPA